MGGLTRRTFLQAVSVAGATAAAKSSPNIIVIMADDMGYSDLGCYGGEIETPNLDRMASRGVRFTHFYNTARCCPTRSSLLTGLYSHQAGVGHMVADRHVPSYQGYLNDRCVTIAEALRSGGYQTGMAGKWHVGEQRPHWPTDRGFDRYFGLISGASNYFRPERVVALQDQPYKVPENYYATDAFTDHAVGHIEAFAAKRQPYFLYLAYTAPHWPLHAHEKDVAKYEGKYLKGWDRLREERHDRMKRIGAVDPRWPLTPRDSKAPRWEDVADKKTFDRKMAVYAAQIDRMDQNIGRVLAKVREAGQEDNTLVMFLADNGGCHEEVNRGAAGSPAGHADSYLSYGLPWANASNTPFRLHKHWVHEGGISTPFIAQWPARLRSPGTWSHQPGHVIDIMATCLDAADVNYPKRVRGKDITPLEGRSLVPILDGKKRRPHDALFWEHSGNRAVREDKWKLVAQHRGDWELYDLDADRTEMRNLAGDDPARVKRMSSLYDAWASRAGVVPFDQLPKG